MELVRSSTSGHDLDAALHHFQRHTVGRSRGGDESREEFDAVRKARRLELDKVETAT